MNEEAQQKPGGEYTAPKGESFKEIEKDVKRPEKAKKRRVGRPTAQEQKEKEAEEKAELEAQLMVDVSAIKGMLEWIFGSLLASRFGSHWKLKSDEAEAGAQAWGAVLNKYAPAAGRFIEEVRAGMWTMGTVGPRWERTKEIMAEQAAKAEREEAPPPPAGGLTRDQQAHNLKVGKQ